MGSQTTKPYRNTLSGSIGAGMGSLFAPGGKKYYILEHRVTSKYHRAGESQEIIVDNIELGRDPHCQVRFDESFKTVSRHHAAIVRDGDMWKLVQISKTNTTFLNGHPVRTEWYLQNGDEIQLSVNGPKLGFIVPTGKKSTVGSIGLTRRLSLFRQQALRPYKTAITVLSCFLVLAVSGGSYAVYKQSKENERWVAHANRMEELAEKFKKEWEDEIGKREKLEHEIDSIKKNPPKQIVRIKEPAQDDIAKILENYKNDIYYLIAQVFYLKDGNATPIKLPERNKKGQTVDKDGNPTDDPNLIKYEYWGWSGTAFLLNDGKLVTARHCIQGWRFPGGPNYLDQVYSQSRAISEGGELVAQFMAISKDGNKIKFTSKDCVYDDRKDKLRSNTFENGTTWKWYENQWNTNNSDWAYYKTSHKGNLEADYESSTKLAAGIELHVLGFPIGLGTDDIESVSPIYTKVNTAIDGCNSAGNIIHTGGTEHGNSGGPVMVCRNGKLYAIGLVSGMATQYGQTTEKYDIATPIATIR